MANWLPIRCPVCGVLHEQPDAAEKVAYCQALRDLEDYAHLHMIRTYNISRREFAVLGGFPELSQEWR